MEKQSLAEPVPDTMEPHHHIGVSQNQYEHIGTFLRTHNGDPAVNVLAFVKGL
jgi:hypothetical protein